MFDAEVSDMLEALNASFPAVYEMTGPQARAAVATRQVPVADLGEVRDVYDRTIPGAHGELGVRLYVPHDVEGRELPVVVFLHGGGFVFCDIDSHDGFCREMARELTSIVVSVDYRRAPEHRAPAAAWDAYHVLDWVARHCAEFCGDPRRVVVAGDSAGGNLAAVACLLSREHGAPMIAGQVLLYPVIDPACDTASFRRYASGYFNTKAAMEWYWRQYLPDAGLPEPQYLVAPLRAPSLADLPPAVVVTAEMDPVSSEGAAYAAALERHDVDVVHRNYAGLFHGFLTLAPLRAAQSARTMLWRDMRALVAPASTQGVPK